MADNSSMLYALLLQPVPKRPTPPRDPARVLGDYFQFPEKNGTENGTSDKGESSEAIICKPEFYRPNRKKKKPKKLRSASRKSHMRRIRAMRGGKPRLKPKRAKREKKKEANNSENARTVPNDDSEVELLDDSEQDPDYCEDDVDDDFDEDDLKPLTKLKEEKPKKPAIPLLKTDKLTRKEQIQLSKTLIAQKFIQNAFQFFTKNKELKYQDFTPSQLTTACLGLHRNTVQKYRTGPLRPPKPPKQRPKPITNITDDSLEHIKATLDELVMMKGQATLDSLFKLLKEKDRFKGGRSSLFSVLKKSGLFKKLHGKTPGNRAGKTGSKKNQLNPDGTPKPPSEKVKGPPKKRAKQAAQLQLQLQQPHQPQHQQPQQQHIPLPPQQQQHHHHQQPQQQHQTPQLQPQLQIPQQPQQQVQQQPPQPQAAHQQPQYQMPQITYSDFQSLQALCQTQPYIPNSQTFGQNQTQAASCQNPLQYPQSFYRL